MTSLFDKTIESISSLFTPLGSNPGLKYLFERCLSARTKYEERCIVQEGLKQVKLKLSEPSVKPSTISRCLSFVVFAEMLGYKAEFAYIHAVKLAQFGTLLEKKMGYLACSYLLRKTDPLSVLLVNTILRDISNKNVVIVALALSASCSCIQPDDLPALLPVVDEKLKHSSEFIRGKAIIVFHHFYRLCPDQCAPYIAHVQELIGDKDPGVVALVLQFVIDIAQSNIGVVEEIAPLLHTILQQILDGKLPMEYTYRKMHAPWMQVSILRLFQYISNPSEDIINIIQRTLHTSKKFSIEAVGVAIICECITALLKYKKCYEVLPIAMAHISELMSRESSNLRYVGLNLLDVVLQSQPLNLTTDQQNVILSSLQHPDLAVKRKTLMLLCSAANTGNAETICSQIIEFCINHCSESEHLQIDMVNRAISLTQKFPRYDDYWHVAMVIRLLPLANQDQIDAIHNYIKMELSSGEENSESITNVKRKVMKILRKYSESKRAATSILELYVWVAAHFCFDVGDDPEQIVHEITELGNKILLNQPEDGYFSSQINKLLVRIVQSLTFMCQHYDICTAEIKLISEKLISSRKADILLRELCSELVNMLPHLSTIRKVNDEQISIARNDLSHLDFTLTFLDKMVCETLETGASPYLPKRSTSITESQIQIQFPVPVASSSVSPIGSEKGSVFDSWSSEDFKTLAIGSDASQKRPEKPIWTKDGRIKSNEDSPYQSEEKSGQNPTEITVSSDPLASLLFMKNPVEEASSEVRDPLGDLLGKDFVKLTANMDKNS